MDQDQMVSPERDALLNCVVCGREYTERWQHQGGTGLCLEHLLRVLSQERFPGVEPIVIEW